ncbi:MAG: hypothetical protein ACP5N6_07605, partial [Anaerolineae bacterium]
PSPTPPPFRSFAPAAALGETHPAPPLDVSDIRRLLAGVKPAPQFQAEFFGRDGLLVAIIGCTGVSSRPRLAKTLAIALGVSPKSGSITRCFERCQRLGLVAVHKAGDAPFSLVSLTSRGRQAFRQIFGYDAVQSEADLLLASHPGSITHAVYCAWAREFAEVAGYTVTIPGKQPAPGPAPDLIFLHGEEVLGVEVERALAGEDSQKWQAIARARDVIAVVAPDHETAERIAVYLSRSGVERYLISDFSYLVSAQPRTPVEFWRVRVPD